MTGRNSGTFNLLSAALQLAGQMFINLNAAKCLQGITTLQLHQILPNRH